MVGNQHLESKLKILVITQVIMTSLEIVIADLCYAQNWMMVITMTDNEDNDNKDSDNEDNDN